MNVARSRPVVLQRLLVTLDCPSEHAQKIQHRCSRLFHEQMGSMIFEPVAGEQRDRGLPAAIDRLAIDLGDIPLSDFEAIFQQRVIELLGVQLARYKSTGSSLNSIDPGEQASDAVPVLSAEVVGSEDSVRWFEHYLNIGYWPSSARSSLVWSAGADPDKWLMERFATEPLLWKTVIASATLAKKNRRRLLRLLSEDTLRRCLDISGPITPSAVLLGALCHFQRHPDIRLPVPEDDDEDLSIRVAGNEAQLDQLLLSDDTSPTLVVWLNALRRQPPLRAWLDERRLTCVSPKMPSGETRHDNPKKERERFPVKHEDKKHDRAEAISRRRHVAAPHERASTLAAGNAGLVALWPLLPDLFSRLGLWRQDRFIDSDAQMNAACWLDATIWTDDCAQEWRMPFTKYLCGLPLDAEVEWRPPSDEVAEVLQSWWRALPLQLPGWHKLDVADIKSLFIQRPGELDLSDTKPVLRVDREPFDILLNDWPWPMDVLMLPWLKHPLSICWL